MTLSSYLILLIVPFQSADRMFVTLICQIYQIRCGKITKEKFKEIMLEMDLELSISAMDKSL